ncbi:MAG TPA: hypothetical protein VGB19_07130 [Actinomycetota bacterium]
MPRIMPRILPMHPADVDFPAGHPHAGESGPILGFAVVHAAGVLLFDTAGHQSLVVRTESGPVLLAGQAVYSAAEWEGSDDPRRSGLPSADDPNADAEFVRRVRDLDPVRSTSPTTRRPGTGGSDSTPPSKGPTMQGP